MFVRVSGSSFKAVMMYMLSAGKCTVNFSINDKNELIGQRLGLVCLEKSIPILERDKAVDDVTVDIDPAIQLLNMNDAVTLSTSGDLFQMQQPGFEYTVARKPEDRIDTSISQTSVTGRFGKYELIHAVNASKFLDSVGRDNLENLSDFVVVGNRAYTTYSNTMLSTPMQLPNLAVQGETVRELIKFMNPESSSQYMYDACQGLLRLLANDETYATIAVKPVNKKSEVEFEQVVNNMKYVTDVSISCYKESLSFICSNYKKQIVELTICTGGVRVYVDNIRTKFVIGCKDQGLFSIKISVSQLAALVKLFGGDSNVEVLKGDNVVCLRQKNLGSQLIMSGIIY